MHLVTRARDGEGNVFVASHRRFEGRPTVSPENEMGIAAGAPGNHVIEPDTHPAELWEFGDSISFIALILDINAFQRVTGMEAPETPIMASTYTECGKSFLEDYKEKSVVDQSC